MHPIKQMSELKSCPFCGDKPRLISLSHGFHVECQNAVCGILVATINVPYKDDAIAAWNTRAESAELSEWRDLMIWGAGPDHVHDFIKRQQARIHAAQIEHEELQRLREVEKAAKAFCAVIETQLKKGHAADDETMQNDPGYAEWKALKAALKPREKK